jgi:uncharacterized small protein (DUF1192 family)
MAGVSDVVAARYGCERMEQARQAFHQIEERIKKPDAEIERLNAER